MADQAPLRIVYPSRKNYFVFWLFGWLVLPALIAIWKRIQLKINIYADRIVVERGKLETDIEEIFLTDIRAIEVRQTLRQRLARIGDLILIAAGTDNRQSVLPGLPRPRDIERFITELRRKQQGKQKTTED